MLCIEVSGEYRTRGNRVIDASSSSISVHKTANYMSGIEAWCNGRREKSRFGARHIVIVSYARPICSPCPE